MSGSGSPPSKKRRKAERAPACPACGSGHVIEIEGEFPSGVIAPDGVSEVICARAWKCLECGTIEEI